MTDAHIAEPLRRLSVPIADLTPDPANARKHGQRNLDAIKASLAAFGQRKPLVVQRQGMIVRAGNGTMQAAKALGWEHIAAVVIDEDSAQAVQFAIADNRTAELAEWDDETLATLLDGMDEPTRDMLAFDDKELAGLMRGLEPDEIVEDEAPEPPVDPITQPGDLWTLGRHRLLCGDSTNADDVARLMGEAQPDVVFTDPPYSSGGFQESSKTIGSIGARSGVQIENDNLSSRGLIALLDRVLANLRHAHTVFVFCDWKMWAHNCDAVEAKGYRVRNMIVWDKMQMGMGMPFRNQHELCVFASKMAGKIGDGQTANVLAHARDRQAEHATPKPVGLISQMMNQVPGNLIVDPFAGGGSTIVAAEQIGRQCCALELTPAYCDVIVERWENLTGQKAVRNG